MNVQIRRLHFESRPYYVAAFEYDLGRAASPNEGPQIFISRSYPSIDELQAAIRHWIKVIDDGESIPQSWGASRSLAELPDGWTAWRCGDLVVEYHPALGLSTSSGNPDNTDSEIEIAFHVMRAIID